MSVQQSQGGHLDVASQVIVTIAVKGKKLSYYPRRDNDVVAYFKEVGKDSPEKPDQVRWVVRDMAPDQFVVIKAKDPNSGIFLPEYKIMPPDNSVATGAPLKQPPKRGDLNWGYSIILMDRNGQVDIIDPMVIIKNDP